MVSTDEDTKEIGAQSALTFFPRNVVYLRDKNLGMHHPEETTLWELEKFFKNFLE